LADVPPEEFATLPKDGARQVDHYNRELDEQGRKRSVSAMVREIWSDLPDEARAKLPADGADQVDHYVYAAPKRD
jgi:hypothetical protein